MGESIRIRTELGLNKSINIELNQEFEFLEILSLKLNQQDIYLRACSDYGVIVGRVTANNGLGLPNARVSIFIPIEVVDESNPIISSIYPYKSPEDKNEDGYRYNLLPYEKSYSTHAATGTLPTRLDVLTGNTAFEIYEKYYKFTAKTNESGDYMIMGVPLGEQTVIMDVDLSDIGEFSLTPQDLIRMGRATESQVAGNRFRTSEDLNSLPQIVNLSKSVEISPLWGEPSICQIAINRVDFDLRDDANIDIQPTSVFIGSIYSTPDEYRIRPPFQIGNLPIGGNRPKDNFGNLCSLQAGPGQILAIRQTINLDASGNPILEQYRLEQNGNVIDSDGAWVVELPMNLDYFVTNEFGERVISYDPTIGIPTKAKYRFKIKWQQPNTFSESVRRPYFLVPNVREFGWQDSANDPNLTAVGNKQQLASSYYFGLDWSGYTEGFNSSQASTKINEIINCEDTFYEFNFNRVYTVSGFLDQYKFGGRARFTGIKEIDSSQCEETTNKFPVNEGFRNFDPLFFIVSLLLQIIQIISIPFIIAIHFIVFFLNVLIGLRDVLVPLFGILSGYHLFKAGQALWRAIRNLIRAAQMVKDAAAAVFSGMAGFVADEIAALKKSARQYFKEAAEEFGVAARYLLATIAIEKLYQVFRGQKIRALTLPVLTYPDCQACECQSNELSSGESLSVNQSSLLSRFSDPYRYFDSLRASTYIQGFGTENLDTAALAFSQAIGGNQGDASDVFDYKTMESDDDLYLIKDTDCGVRFYAYSNYLPFGERINIFNLRKKYFDGVNKIKVTFDSSINTRHHFDNTLTVFTELQLESGTLLSFVNPQQSTDKNYTYSGNTTINGGIYGEALNPGPSQYTVQWCDPNNPYSNRSTNYQLSIGSEVTGYTFPADIEYYQVITAITVSQAISMFQGFPNESLPQLVNSGTMVYTNNQNYIKVAGVCFALGWGRLDSYGEIPISQVFDNFAGQYITILQRGVDPYSPKFTNKYGLGLLFGSNDPDAVTMTATTRLNIPIQKLNTGTGISVQPFTQNGQSEIFYQSHFFRGGIPNSLVVGQQWSAFTTFNVGYYSSQTKQDPGGFGVYGSNTPPVNDTLISSPFNGAFTSTPQTPSQYPAKYSSYEDLSGGAFYYVTDGDKPNNTSVRYTTKVLLPFFSANPMNITSNVLNVMRTDRLPSSDNLDGGSWSTNPALLQQNLGFSMYQITSYDSGEIGVVPFSTGADIVTQDLEGQYAYNNVIDSLNVCSEIVSLRCYESQGTSFAVNQNCADKDAVIRGCYQFVKRPLLDIGKDVRNFNEWAYRFRFNYALCRGVLSQTFTNNWINGSLFTFPIQVDQTFNSRNKPNPPSYPARLTYFDSKTNNFYYRSSPFLSGSTSSAFIGAPADLLPPQNSVNARNLLFPTTIMNLGMKDAFFKEIVLEPSANGYVLQNLNTTSYFDNSDIVNLFVISRITNASFLQQMLNARDSSINSLFTRNNSATALFQPKNRVDADLVQLLSINNEVGNIGFSPEFYPFNPNSTNNPVVVLSQPSNNSTIGIFFSSTTEDLQIKDFLSPGVIDFRFNPNVTAVTYRYGIKSQKVPFYQWELRFPNSQPSIFGSEKNNWSTNLTDIVTSRYQELDRRSTITPNYFVPEITSLDVNQRGYIFNIDNSGNYVYNTFSGMDTKFLIGAPNQFYFGLVKGASALDKFKQKYLPNE